MEFLTPPDNVTSFASVQLQTTEFSVAELIRLADDITSGLIISRTVHRADCERVIPSIQFLCSLSSLACLTDNTAYLILSRTYSKHIPSTTNCDYNGEKMNFIISRCLPCLMQLGRNSWARLILAFDFDYVLWIPRRSMTSQEWINHRVRDSST